MKTIHYLNEMRSHLVTIVPMTPFTPKSPSKLRSALYHTKESLKAVHTAAVSKSRRKQTVNRVLRDRPPDISETETSLRRPQRTTLSQLRSGHCHLLNSYKHRIGREDDPQCKDCGCNNQDVNHLFDCPAHPTVMSPTKLWSLPADTIGEFAYLDTEQLD